MRRSLLVLAALLALVVGSPTVEAAPLLTLTHGDYSSRGDCDLSCWGWLVLDGTFAVGGVEVDDVARVDWVSTAPPDLSLAGDYGPFVGPLVGTRLSGLCTWDRTLYREDGRDDVPTVHGTVTCEASVDGGPVQSFSFVLVTTHYSDDNGMVRTNHGRIIGV